MTMASKRVLAPRNIYGMEMKWERNQIPVFTYIRNFGQVFYSFSYKESIIIILDHTFKLYEGYNKNRRRKNHREYF